MTTPDLVPTLGRIQARVYAIDTSAFGEGNDLVAIAVRTEVERIISEEVVKWLDLAAGSDIASPPLSEPVSPSRVFLHARNQRPHERLNQPEPLVDGELARRSAAREAVDLHVDSRLRIDLDLVGPLVGLDTETPDLHVTIYIDTAVEVLDEDPRRVRSMDDWIRLSNESADAAQAAMPVEPSEFVQPPQGVALCAMPALVRLYLLDAPEVLVAERTELLLVARELLTAPAQRKGKVARAWRRILARVMNREIKHRVVHGAPKVVQPLADVDAKLSRRSLNLVDPESGLPGLVYVDRELVGLLFYEGVPASRKVVSMVRRSVEAGPSSVEKSHAAASQTPHPPV